METQFHLPIGIIASFIGMLLCCIIMWGFYNNIRQGQDRSKNMRSIGICAICLIVCIAVFVISVL